MALAFHSVINAENLTKSIVISTETQWNGEISLEIDFASQSLRVLDYVALRSKGRHSKGKQKTVDQKLVNGSILK
jgi:hypothetical protein